MRILLVTLLFVSVLPCNAQIFTRTIYMDKFDDIQKETLAKTIIYKTDSTITFETKGKKPIVYYRGNQTLDSYIGSVKNPKNLIEDVYGYEEKFFVFDVNPVTICMGLFEKGLNNENTSQQELESLKPENHSLYITHRVVSKYEFVFEYKNEYWWINYPNGSRILYIK